MVVQLSKNTYEEKTQAIATELLASTRENRSWWAQMREMRWDSTLLAWAMNNPGLRVQLFHLIDCLPALPSNAEIAHHLQEYMTASQVELPDALKKLLNFSKADSVPGQLAGGTFSKAVETLAYRYIAGETVEQVIKTVERLRREKMAFTIDLLGEAVISESEARDYYQGYLNLMQRLRETAQKWSVVPEIDQADGQRIPQVQISVKLTALYSQFDPLAEKTSRDRVLEKARSLLRRAGQMGVAIHFDMEQYAYKDLTLSILKELLTEDEFRQRSDVGITIQAYLRESDRDLQDMIEWAKQRGTPLTVRLVKGAYWDTETIRALKNHWAQPVFNHKAATDANFEYLTQLLLENHEHLHAAIGSHNVRSQALACAIAEDLKIPRRRFEMQVLYGMGEKLAKTLVKRGHRVRVYAPYGKLLPGMAYLIRRLLENTANSSFLKQDLEERPIDELIAPPKLTEAMKTQQATYPSPTKNYQGAADSDYAQIEKREAAQHAFAQVQRSLGKTILPFINGKYRPTDTYIDSANPSHPDQVVAKLGMVSVEQAEEAIASAKQAFHSWKQTPVEERVALLRRAADLMENRRAELAAWMVLETGKTLRQADVEVSEAIDMCRYYASEMERLQPGWNFDVPGETNRYHYQPRGITLVIAPWNFSIAIPTGMTVASLVAGNCTLLKPAEFSTVVASKIAEILIAAGVPEGVFQFIPGKGSTVGTHLVKHKDVNTIVFTGSQEVGCQIYADASVLQPGQKHLKRVIAEMGGKNGIIVDESADLDEAVAGVVHSAFGYSGQKCSACSRAIVVERCYDRFLERLIEATRSLHVGDAALPSTTVGPVIDASAANKIREYIEIGKKEAQVALEMPAPKEGYFVGPVIFTDVSPNATIAQEEIFGPVLSVIRVRDFDEALQVANDTNYALTGGLYSRTPSHIDRAKEEFEVGNLYINRGITGSIIARQPFGGFKLSGVGSKAGGPDYLLQFLEPRTVTENIQRQGFAPIEGADY